MSVKIRRGQLEVKEQLDVRVGFQQWKRPLRHPLPCPPSTVADLLVALTHVRTDPSNIARRNEPVDLSSILQLSIAAGIQPIEVYKRRERFRVDGQRVEKTTMKIKGSPFTLKCAVLEGSDLDDLIRLRRVLRLDDGHNISIHQALAQTVRRRGGVLSTHETR